jgi:hypothetical protein
VVVDPLSHSTILERGHVEARESTFTVSTVPPQTLASWSDPEGAEARGTAHCVAATVVFFHTDTTNSYYDHRRRHVVVFVG